MTVRKSTAAVAGVFALLLAVPFVTGCGGGGAASPTAPSAAKNLLTQALDAWKAGKPKDSLTRGSPSILMNDSDWERRSKLTDYKLEGDGEPLGASVKWNVPLTLSVKGKTLERQAVYAVNVSEGIVTISRMDLDL